MCFNKHMECSHFHRQNSPSPFNIQQRSPSGACSFSTYALGSHEVGPTIAWTRAFQESHGGLIEVLKVSALEVKFRLNDSTFNSCIILHPEGYSFSFRMQCFETLQLLTLQYTRLKLVMLPNISNMIAHKFWIRFILIWNQESDGMHMNIYILILQLLQTRSNSNPSLLILKSFSAGGLLHRARRGTGWEPQGWKVSHSGGTGGSVGDSLLKLLDTVDKQPVDGKRTSSTGWWFGYVWIGNFNEFHHPNWRTHISKRGWNHQTVYML